MLHLLLSCCSKVQEAFSLKVTIAWINALKKIYLIQLVSYKIICTCKSIKRGIMTAKVKLVDLYFQFRVENNLDLVWFCFHTL